MRLGPMKLRALFGVTAVTLGAAMVTMIAPAASAAAYGAPGGRGTEGGGGRQRHAGRQRQLDGLQSWQTDGIVWALAYANGVLYAGGQFGNALPPGTPAGSTTGEVRAHVPGRVQLDHGGADHLVRPGDHQHVDLVAGACTRWPCRRTARRSTSAATSTMSTAPTGTTWPRSAPRPAR